MIAHPDIEQMSREDMSALQLKKLKKQLAWAMEKSSFYQKKFTDAGITADSVQELSDLSKLPFTTLEELQAENPYSMLTLPLSAILRISCVGYSNPLIKMYTNGDLAYQIEMVTRVLVAQGLHHAVVAGLLGEGSDSRLMDIQYALENMGVTVILMGNESEAIRRLMTNCHIDVLIGDFRKISKLIVVLQGNNFDLSDLYLPKIVCMEEALQNPNARYIEQRLNVKSSTVYSDPVMGCGGVMFPCGEAGGMHVQEDHFIAEIVEFGTNGVITETHRSGMLVLTALSSEAMPIFRYCTNQVVMRLDDGCPCGRTFSKLASPTEYAGMVWQVVPPTR